MNFSIATSSAPGGASASQDNSAEHRKLSNAAEQFEGMLLQELLKPMKQHGIGQQEEEDDGDSSGFGDTLSSYGTEAMATAIAHSGGLGIARKIVTQVEGEKARHSTATGLHSH